MALLAPMAPFASIAPFAPGVLEGPSGLEGFAGPVVAPGLVGLGLPFAAELAGLPPVLEPLVSLPAWAATEGSLLPPAGSVTLPAEPSTQPSARREVPSQ